MILAEGGLVPQTVQVLRRSGREPREARSRKEGRVEGEAGQGLYPFLPRSKPLVAAPQPLHVPVCAYTRRSAGMGPWGLA